MRKLEGRVIVWATYLDALKPRSKGRRVPMRLASEAPRLEEILEAAKALGLNPEPRLKARHPASWWQASGYAVVDKRGSKASTLAALALKVKELRKARA